MSSHQLSIEPLEARCLLSAGDLDPAFGIGGVFAYPDIPGPALGIATQSDGKYVVATHTTLYRFRENGTIDKSFGHRGHIVPGFTLFGVGIDHGGRIAVGGSSEDHKWAAARYNPDGTPDLSFNGTGQIITHAGALATDEYASVMAIQPDGKILIGGVQFNGRTDDDINYDYNAVVVRFNTNGAIDTAFGDGGEAFDSILFNHVDAIATAPNGNIAIAGATRSGQSVYDEYYQVVNSAGRFVTGTPAAFDDPSLESEFRAAAYRPDNTLLLADEDEANSDLRIGSKPVGIVLDPLSPRFYDDEKINALVTTADNKTLVAGSARNGLGLLRLNPDGTPDNTFAFGGFDEISINRRKSEWIDRLALLPNGDYLAAGTVGGTFPENTDSGYLFVAHIQGGAHTVGQLAPRALADATAPPLLGSSLSDFTVTYGAEETVDAASLGSYDLRVLGPNGYSALAHLANVEDRYAGRQRVATYTIDAPGGVWERGDNGPYTIYLRPNQVADNRGQAVPAGIIGTFTVGLRKGRHHPPAAAITAAAPTLSLRPANALFKSMRPKNDLFDA
jgi:uncharacterized delta-60 repeat protein